ncbi:MAG: hypothetical protein ACLR78_04245 [Roseburia sp.]
MADFFAEFASLSPIGHGFPELWSAAGRFCIIRRTAAAGMRNRSRSSAGICRRRKSVRERLLFYFLYSLGPMPGFYDGDLYMKAKMAVFGAVAAERAGDGGVFQRSRKVWEENRRGQRERCRACNVSGK